LIAGDEFFNQPFTIGPFNGQLSKGFIQSVCRGCSGRLLLLRLGLMVIADGSGASEVFVRGKNESQKWISVGKDNRLTLRLKSSCHLNASQI
jgi:hypothetical protein